MASPLEHSNESPDSIKGREFLKELSDSCYPKEDPAPWSLLLN